MEDAIVLYPTAAIGHVTAMVEFGKVIRTQNPSLSIHILTTVAPYDTGSTTRYIAAVSAAEPWINFRQLPAVTLPPDLLSSTSNHEDLTFEVLRLNIPNVHQGLQSISKHLNIKAFIADFFCFDALSVALQPNIRAYALFTSGACCLACLLYIPTLHRITDKSFKDLNTLLNIPGLPPIPSWDMLKPLLDRNDKAYERFFNCSVQLSKSTGIIINTFQALEPRVLRALSDGLFVTDGPTPPIYCLGPLINDSKQKSGGSDGGDGCLKWLDSQLNKSVVFLCFGSLGVFSKEQLHQIAVGLERSGHRFLWVVKNPPSEQSQNLAASSQEDPDLDSLLPEGFVDRTRDRGLVVRKWAPQVAVLRHESVGGFVSHCGWNSVLEAVCGGVPIIAWPLYAEQRFNRVVLVEEMKIALWMHETESGFVTAAEVEERVRELMESEEGEVIRKRMMIMKGEVEAAFSENGSSRVELAKLVESWN